MKSKSVHTIVPGRYSGIKGLALLLLFLTTQILPHSIIAAENTPTDIEYRSYTEREQDLTDIKNPMQATSMKEWIEITRGENIALGKSITASKNPNDKYGPKNRPENLLDGRLSKREDGKLWFSPEAFSIIGDGIRWTGLQLCLDLKAIYPVQTIAMRVMGGGATVSQQIAKCITVLASQNGIDFYKVDTFHKLGAEEADAANGKNLFYVHETGENFVFTVRFTTLQISARYIVFQISGANSFISDEIAVIKGNFDLDKAFFLPEAKRVYIQEGVGLYPDKNVLAVSRNIITPNFFTLVDMRKEEDLKQEVTCCIELPPYLEILKANPRLSILSVDVLDSGQKKWSFRGMKYSRGSAIGPIYLKITDEPGERQDTSTFYIESQGYPEQKRTFPVLLFDIPRVPLMQMHHISLAWITDRERMEWPFFLEAYRHMGFNAVPTSPRNYMGKIISASSEKEKVLTSLQEAREAGFKILQNESTFHLMYHAAKGNDEIYSQLNDPNTPNRTQRTSLCPSYRGNFYQEEIRRFVDAVNTVRPDIIFHDIECWSWGCRLAPNCRTCLEYKTRLGISNQDDFIFSLGREHMADLKAGIAKLYNGTMKIPPCGLYGLKAAQGSRSDWGPYLWEKLYPDLVDFSQPSLYVGADMIKIRKSLSAEFQKVGKRIAIPWLTTGTAGEYDPKKIEPMLYLAFLNGVAGITYFSFLDFDSPLDYYYHSKALSILAPLEDVLVSGKIIPGTCNNNSLLTSAWYNSEKRTVILLIYNHISRRTEKAQWSLPGLQLKEATTLIDLRTAKSFPAKEINTLFLEPGEFALFLLKDKFEPR